jgi:urease accessory protein
MKLAATLALLRFTSPALPIGGYAYSRGLEGAAHAGLVHDEASVGRWILGTLEHVLCPLDGAIGVRLHHAFRAGDLAQARRWSAELRACRESRELALEDEQLGLALGRVLTQGGVPEGDLRALGIAPSHVGAFMRAAVHHDVALPEALGGYAYAFCEGQVSASLRLLSLGQTAGQRILQRALELLEGCVARTLALTDDDIGSFAPGLALVSAQHETQYSRLFRS